MEEQITTRIKLHKDVFAKMSPFLFLLCGIVFIIGSIMDRSFFFKPDDYERWSHRWSFRQVSLTWGRMTSRIYAFVSGIILIAFSVWLGYMVYLIYYSVS